MLKNIHTLLKKLFAGIQGSLQEDVYIEEKATPENNYISLLINKMLDDKCFDKSISQGDFTKTITVSDDKTDYHEVLNRLKKMANLPLDSSKQKTNGYFTLRNEGFEYRIEIIIEADHKVFKIHIEEIGEYTEKKPIKTIKCSEIPLTFPVRPEFIAKNTASPKKWSIIIFFIILIIGPFVIMFTPDADIWGLLVALVVFPLFTYFMIIYSNTQYKEIYVAINEKSLYLSPPAIFEVKFNKLKKIELIRDYNNEELLMIKFYTTNISINGGGLKSEMFDLEPIVQKLKSLDSILQDIWTEKTIIVKKKYHRLILFFVLFLLIIICIFLYLSGDL